MMSSGTGPSFQRVERAPRISHWGQIQSSFAAARGRRAPGGPGGGGGGGSGGQTRTHLEWNPLSQASHTKVLPSSSWRPQDAQTRGGNPQPASPGCGAGRPRAAGSSPAGTAPMGPKGVFLSSTGRWSRSTTSSASCWSRSCWLGETSGSSGGGSCGCGCGCGCGGSGGWAGAGTASAGGGNSGACGGGDGGGDGASLRSMSRCGWRSMAEWGIGLALTPGSGPSAWHREGGGGGGGGWGA